MFQYVCYLCTPLSTLARKFKKDFLTQTSRERDREGGEITHCNTHNTHTHTHTHTRSPATQKLVLMLVFWVRTRGISQTNRRLSLEF